MLKYSRDRKCRYATQCGGGEACPLCDAGSGYERKGIRGQRINGCDGTFVFLLNDSGHHDVS